MPTAPSRCPGGRARPRGPGQQRRARRAPLEQPRQHRHGERAGPGRRAGQRRHLDGRLLHARCWVRTAARSRTPATWPRSRAAGGLDTSIPPCRGSRSPAAPRSSTASRWAPTASSTSPGTSTPSTGRRAPTSPRSTRPPAACCLRPHVAHGDGDPGDLHADLRRHRQAAVVPARTAPPRAASPRPVRHTDASLRQHFTAPQVRRSWSGKRSSCRLSVRQHRRPQRHARGQSRRRDRRLTGDLLAWTPASLPTNRRRLRPQPRGACRPGHGLTHGLPRRRRHDFVAAYDFSTGAQQWREDMSGSAQAITVAGRPHRGRPLRLDADARSGNAATTSTPTNKCYHSPRLVATNAATGHVCSGGGAQAVEPRHLLRLQRRVGAGDRHQRYLPARGRRVHAGGGTWTFNAEANQWDLIGAATQDDYARLEPWPLRAPTDGPTWRARAPGPS